MGQSAASHLAHLICEIYLRNEVDLGHERNFELLLTQDDLADIVGITPIHVSRCISQLRVANLITWERRRMTILDFPGRAALAHFNPRYLRLAQ